MGLARAELACVSVRRHRARRKRSLRLPIGELEYMLAHVPALQHEFIRTLSETISRDRRLLLMGCMDAEQRVARLLVSLADRYQRLGYAPQELLLHMTRDDIASYLCLSSETVSRVMTRLRQKGLLRCISVTSASRTRVDSPKQPRGEQRSRGRDTHCLTASVIRFISRAIPACRPDARLCSRRSRGRGFSWCSSLVCPSRSPRSRALWRNWL